MKTLASVSLSLLLVACGSKDEGATSSASASSKTASSTTPAGSTAAKTGPSANPTAGGCSKETAPCSGEGTIKAGGRDRTFHYHLAKNDKPGLVIALHGKGGNGAGFEKNTHFDRVGDEHGFDSIFPDGIDKSWASFGNKAGAGGEGVDDVAFVSQLIDYAIATYGVDGNKVIVAGFSNGGQMAERVGCELAGKITAIGLAAGSMQVEEAPLCKPARPISVIAFHGDADETQPYKGRPAGANQGELLSAPDTIAKWAEREHCGATPKTTDEPNVDPDDGTTTKRATYDGCNANVHVVFFTVAGGGHAWPVGPAVDEKKEKQREKKEKKEEKKEETDGADKKVHASHDVDASELIWQLGIPS